MRTPSLVLVHFYVMLKSCCAKACPCPARLRFSRATSPRKKKRWLRRKDGASSCHPVVPTPKQTPLIDIDVNREETIEKGKPSAGSRLSQSMSRLVAQVFARRRGRTLLALPHLCIRIHASMRSNTGSSSSQYPFRRSALRRSLTTCSSVI